MPVIHPDFYAQTIQIIQTELTQFLFEKYLSFSPLLTIGVDADLLVIKVYVVLETSHGKLQFSKMVHPIMMGSNLPPDYTGKAVAREILHRIEADI